MNFQQLRSIRETVRCGFNLTEAACVLHTSQPGVSRQIRELEEELGFDFFVRSGKRLTGLTEPGEHVLPIIERMLVDACNLKTAGQEFIDQNGGVLSVATTHSQARYALPGAVRDFRALYPNVSLHLHQGSPKQVAEMLLSGDASVGIATEALSEYEDLIVLPCYRWTHSVLVPPDHPLLQEELTLENLARYPLITYNTGFTGRSRIDQAFAEKGLVPSIVLTAMDADVIKAYVQLGMGVGLAASMSFESERDVSLRELDAGGLFGINLTKLAIRKGTYLRGYAYAFIQSFVPTLTRDVVEAAQQEP